MNNIKIDYYKMTEKSLSNNKTFMTIRMTEASNILPDK